MSDLALFFGLLCAVIAASALVAVVECVAEWIRDRRD
jgi:hypothetical protein